MMITEFERQLVSLTQNTGRHEAASEHSCHEEYPHLCNMHTNIDGPETRGTNGAENGVESNVNLGAL